MKEQAKQERAKPKNAEQKSTVLTVQVLWACHAFNASPKEAAHRVVADLLQQLSNGGTVPVYVEDANGQGCTLEVSAAYE